LNDYAHPAFEPYRDLLALLEGRRGLAALNEMAERLDARHTHTAKALRFASLPGACAAAEYEQGIAASGNVPTREDNLHDFLNALVWLRFPELKSALNQRHCEVLAQQPKERTQRGRQRDQLTLLDESGMLFACAQPALLDLLRAKKWVELFWNRRMDVHRHVRFVVVGHGLLEKCLAPFPGMTAKCLLLPTAETTLPALDRLAAAAVLTAQALELPPLPVQGVPGWDANEGRSYYEDTRVFRPARAAY
jgi:hypothetical protein